MDVLDRCIETINQQKGELVAIHTLMLGLLRGLPLALRDTALTEFDIEVEAARVVMLNSGTPEAVLSSFDRTVATLNALRIQR